MSDEKQTKVITAYKGFDMQMQCRKVQFEIGKTYEHDGEVKACESGFHSCENPLDVLRYYEPGCSLFAEVEASGEVHHHSDDSKIASGRIHIKAQISIPDFINHAFAYVLSKCTPATSSHATGYRSASSATGDRSASSATGHRSASSATGHRSASSATGDSSASSATGHSSASSATGDSSASSATGKGAVALNTGRYGKSRAGEGGAIVLCEHDEEGNLINIKCSKVGQHGIKADVFYTLKDGEFVEVLE